MGCFSSRFDKRNQQSGDFNTVGAAFFGGKDTELFDSFPVDRVLAALDLEKEPADLVGVEADLKLTNEEQVTEIFKATRTFLRDHFKNQESQYGTPADAKDVYVGDKYKAKDALTQLQNTIDHLQQSSGIADDAPAAEPAAEEKPAEEPAAMDEMMEGGDDNMEMVMEGMENMAMEAMEKPNPFTYDKDERKYEGWDQVAAALLRNMLVNPIFGDMLRGNAVSWEYNHEKGTRYPELSRAAALVSAAAAKAVSGENNVFVSGYLDQESFEALGDLVSAKANIHFPFVTAGWGSKDEALNALEHTPLNEKRKGDFKRVLFEVTGAASFSFAGCRQITHRLNGAIAGGEEADGVHVYQVTAKALEAQTVADWKKAREAPAEPVAAAAPAEEAPKEGEMEAEKMEEPAAMEGM